MNRHPWYPNNTSQNIAQQTGAAYQNYEKTKAFKDVGYFLQNYVNSGGNVTQDVTHNNIIHVSDISAALNNNVMARDGAIFQSSIPNTTYYLDFGDNGDWHWGTAHYVGTHITIASVATNSAGNVSTITDTRGHVGGFRLKDEYGLEGYATTEQLADIVYDIKVFGAKGDGSDDSAAIQATINAAEVIGATVYAPPGTYKLQSGLVIKKKIAFTAAAGVKLDFSDMASGFALTIGDGSTLVGVIVSGFNIECSTGVTALRLNATSNINHPVVDGRFSDMRISQAGVGLHGAYSWGIQFSNIRFQDCAKCVELGSQFNHVEFDRVSFVSTSDFGNLTNCEGINFTTCEFANNSARNLAIFQSVVTLINPYVEYVANFLQIGLSSENENVKSQVTINGGLLCGKIRIYRLNGTLAIIGTRTTFDTTFGIDNIAPAASSIYSSTNISIDNLNLNVQPKWLSSWHYNVPRPYADAWGGGGVDAPARYQYREFTVTTDGQGLLIATGLVVGNQYVFVLAMQRSTGTTVGIRHGSSYDISSQISTAAGADDFKLQYFPFIARDTAFRLELSGTKSAQVRFMGMIDGLMFPRIDLKTPLELFSVGMPSAGTWPRGAVVNNASPSPGLPAGWQCSTAGTPGIWSITSQSGLLPSIANTPSFVGQEAISGSQIYKATGTTSSADWKQIT